LVARGAQAKEQVAQAEQIARTLLGDLVYGVDDDPLEAVLVRSLTERRQTVALAESCTGGAIAHRLTNVPGASVVFLAGFVAYSNDAKEKFLGVQAATLAAQGAVSEAVAKEMAGGARARAGTDYAISVTGIAGPGGGTPEKPVGTVWMALAGPSGVAAHRRMNPADGKFRVPNRYGSVAPIVMTSREVSGAWSRVRPSPRSVARATGSLI
jgi:nicotinamide-nucleotide amidase